MNISESRKEKLFLWHVKLTLKCVFAQFSWIQFKLFHTELIENTILSGCLGRGRCHSYDFRKLWSYLQFSLLLCSGLLSILRLRTSSLAISEKKKNICCANLSFLRQGLYAEFLPQGFSPPLFNFCLEILHGEKLKVEHIGVLRCAWPVYARGSW